MVRCSGLAFLSRLGVVVVISIASVAGDSSSDSQILLRQNWFIQPSTDVRSDGAAISQPGFSTQGWYPATLPSTVLSALVEDQVYPDPYVGMNLRSIPGTTYPIFEDFSNIQMPPSSPFRHPWWYRTEFKLSAEYKDKTIWLGSATRLDFSFACRLFYGQASRQQLKG